MACGGLHISMPEYSVIIRYDRFYEEHNNWLSRIATLGNRSSLENLNLAYRIAKFQRNYSLYLFDSRGRAEFMATANDGPTVVMYSRAG